MSEEIALLGGPPFAQRAQASEEYIQAFRELWTAEKPVRQGPYAAFDKLLFAQKSVQLPHAPIWLGGERLAFTGSVQAIVDDIGHRSAVMERIFKALLSLSSNSPPK